MIEIWNFINIGSKNFYYNMVMDEVLLNFVLCGEIDLVIRFYIWNFVIFLIGYF